MWIVVSPVEVFDVIGIPSDSFLIIRIRKYLKSFFSCFSFTYLIGTERLIGNQLQKAN